ncbi:MAG: hypothetical protein J2P17_19745, partial [Mycobacterium sp.]|nr:hypothetical protein [Mycobacterium sp.]
MNQLPDTAGGVDAPPEPTANIRWAVRDGVELLGPVLDSGLSAPTFLLRRHDGQVVQVSELINIVLEELCPERTLAEVAATVSARYQRRLTSDGLSHLLTGTLSRLGLVSPTDAKPTVAEERNLPRATPILSLTLRGTLLPAAATRRVASVLRGLYWPPVVVAALLGWLALDVLVVLSAGRAGLADAITQLLSAPALVLALYAAMTLASLIHETGHAAASRYGGAVPGRIGVGVYIIYVAFYTDV